MPVAASTSATGSTGDESITPRVRLFTERLQVDMGSYYAPDFQEIEAPALQLSFDYGGANEANGDAEARARFLLESLGALELSCAEHVEAPVGSDADYVVRLDGDVHAKCGFAAYAIPQLEALGWQVEIDPSYRWRVLDSSVAPWYASLEPDEEADWFSLELGVEHNGQRVNLLPTLLDMLESGGQSLTGLLRKRRCIAVPMSERGFVALPPERLQRVAEVLLELYDKAELREQL